MASNGKNKELATVLVDCEQGCKGLLQSLENDPLFNDDPLKILERIEKLCAEMRLIRFDFYQPLLVSLPREVSAENPDSVDSTIHSLFNV